MCALQEPWTVYLGQGCCMRRFTTRFVLEEVAKMAARCEMINPDVKEAPQCLQDKHYLRKHGPGAYYGQGNL